MSKAVIFDLDGTLLNTLGDLTAAINHGLTAHGLPTRTQPEVRSYVGDGVRELVVRACPADVDEEVRAGVMAAYLPYYAAHNMDLTCPYEGVLSLLSELKECGYRIAVVSNKHNAGTQALCGKFFADYLDLAVGADGSRPLKPAPDGVLYAIRQLQVAPKDVWYVGDSVQDVRTAHNAGVKCAAVTWGFQDADRLAAENPTVMVDSVAQLREVILSKEV